MRALQLRCPIDVPLDGVTNSFYVLHPTSFWLQAAGKRRYHWAALAAAAAVMFRQTNAVWALFTLAVGLQHQLGAGAEFACCWVGPLQVYGEAAATQLAVIL